MIRTISILLAALLLFAIACGAQTGIVATATSPETAGWTLGSTNPPPAAWKWKTANDAAELLGDFGIHVTGREIISIIGLMVAASGAARGLRKFLPDSWQANKLGVWLAHIALEVNPTLEKLRAAANDPKAEFMGALIESKINQKLSQAGLQSIPSPQPQPPATAISKTP